MIPFFISFLLLTTVAFAQETLTNDSIVKMVAAGLGENLIVEAIESHPGSYALSTDDMVKLKQDHVPDKVLSAMMARSAGKEAPAMTLTAADVCPAKEGLYYRDGSSWTPMFDIRIEGSGAKVNPVPIFGGVKSVMKFRGSAATLTVVPTPRFCFRGSPELARNAVVATLVVKGDHREIETGSAHAFTGAKMGVADKNVHLLEIKNVSDSVTELSVQAPLPPGQYLLLPSSASASRGFDFTVR